MGDARPRYGRGAATTITAITALCALGIVTACGSGDPAAGPPGASPTAKPVTLAITPAAGTANVPISTEVGVKAAGGEVSDVALTKAGSTAKLAGTMRADGTSWVPAAPLDFSATYDAAVTGRAPDGRTVTQKTTFSTMGRPGNDAGTAIYLFNGETVGVAMPVVLEFDPPVPDSARAEVQKRLFVTTNPSQPGVWSWPSGRQAWYRAPTYWQPGTTISVRSALAGLPMGEGRYGDEDRTATVTVGARHLLDVDNATKQMKVYANDQLVKVAAVSLGKPSTPSSSGYMVVMSRAPSTIFDTNA